MNDPSTAFSVAGSGLRLSADIVPWDSAVFGFPVAWIQEIDVTDKSEAVRQYVAFKRWRDEAGIRIVSCRLPHNRLSESMFLEAMDFRFIEMVLHPRIKNLQKCDYPQDDLIIAPADRVDIGRLREIAEGSFGHERYHIDPRLDRRLADVRYGRWVTNSLDHPRQRLLKVMLDQSIIALFIVEIMEERIAYWHLTTIDPQCRGKGYGQRVWRAMLKYHKANGLEGVATTIAARNVAVLNLYAKLGFRFLPPEMTFHWVMEGE